MYSIWHYLHWEMSHDWINSGDSALSQLRHVANFPKEWQTRSVIINFTLGPGLSLAPRYFTLYCLAPPRLYTSHQHPSPPSHWSTDPPLLICHLSSSRLDGHCALHGCSLPGWMKLGSRMLLGTRLTLLLKWVQLLLPFNFALSPPSRWIMLHKSKPHVGITNA